MSNQTSNMRPKNLKKEIITYTDSRGENITLYSVKIRVDGTRQVFNGILAHNNRWEDNDRDYLSGGAVDLNAPTTADEAEILMELAAWTRKYRIDGNGYYIFD